MNLREALAFGEKALTEAGITDARIDARLLLEWAAEISLTEYAMNPFRSMTEGQKISYKNAVEKRSKRIPLQHITGEQEFMGFAFRVDSSVLIPRQDTELLAEEALKRIRPGMRVLDLCTGSGCIAISLEKLSRKNGSTNERNQFTGSDISPEALRIARENGRRHGAGVSFVESDLFERLEGSFDMIVSNPPYIRTSVIEELEEEVRSHDPVLALDGKEDGLYFYRRIIPQAKAYLKDGGWLLFEIGHDQKDAVTGLMMEAGYREITVRKDLTGLDRVVIGRYYE